MVIQYIPADSRGLTKTDWLTSYHSFSFGEYHDPKRIGFGRLRVLNDDTIDAANGFPLHSHDNMEIITFVLDGSLEHKDSIGNRGVIKAGQMQRMTAGTGIKHSEFNASKEEPVHLLQIWIMPKEKGLKPDYEQKEFSSLLQPNEWQLIVSPQKKDNALFIHQDVLFLMGLIEEDTTLTHTFSAAGKGGYCFLIEGEVQIDGQTLEPGDAAVVTAEKQFSITALQPSFCLLIETSL